MGLHLCLVTKESVDHPEWDSGRCAGDTEFVAGMSGLPSVRWSKYPMDDVSLVRPEDFGPWRKMASEVEAVSENIGRLHRLLDILEADDRYWIYVSW